MKNIEILKSLLNLLSFKIQDGFNLKHRITQYFSKRACLLSLYAPGRTIIYYPPIYSRRTRENPVETFFI